MGRLLGHGEDGAYIAVSVQREDTGRSEAGYAGMMRERGGRI